MQSATAHDKTAPGFDTLPRLAASFAARGDRAAIAAYTREGAVTMSYAELARAVGCVARGLAARGIGRGDRVALFGPNGADWVTAYFGIVCAGATAVPIDVQSTPASAAAALAHAAPKLLFTTAALAADLRALAGAAPPETLAFDGAENGAWLRLRAHAGGETLPEVEADDIASLLFTSGTTGTPKAVPLTHANLVSNVRELGAAHLIAATDRVLLPLPLHHTYPFTVGLLTPLSQGALVVLPSGVSGPEIAQAAAGSRATEMLAVPRLCSALVDSVTAAVSARGRTARLVFRALLGASVALVKLTGWHVGRWLFRSVHDRLGPDLRLIGCGGAKLPGELAWRLEGLGWRVLTGYGLTETSPVLTFNQPRALRIGSEGRALPGVEIRIATDTTPGEIQARGPNVFAGYWHNEAANATAFTSDGWFRTGDLGHVDADGYLHVVGRSKELIVLADGKKLFPEAIEKLYESPLLREIAIFEHGGVLVALVVPDERTVRERGALREAALLREAIEDIAARLAPYQRLAAYRVSRAPLPRTHLGKLKRHLLPELFAAADKPALAATSAEPSAADRELLAMPRAAEAWRWLGERYPERPLTLDTSPQLDLGIDSLEWVTLTIEIERRFGVALTGEALSRILTLRDLLSELVAASPAAPSASTPSRFTRPGAALRMLGAALQLALRLGMRVAWPVRVTGAASLPVNEALLITPNHASYLDPPALIAALPWSVLRRTYWAGWVGVMHTSPLRRLVSRATQVFPVDPDRALATAVETAAALLRDGYNVVWFPEGRRSPTGEPQAFQSGVGVLLERSGATALPTAIAGTFHAWPKHRAWPRRGPLDVRFGTALRWSDTAPPPRIRDDLEAAVRDLFAASAAAAPRDHATETTMLAPPPPIPPPVTIALRDGRRVAIRPIRRDDVDSTTRFLDGLSPPSKHYLFLGGIARMSDAALAKLCDPDSAHDMAYVAIAEGEAGERLVGLCRYAGAGAEGAEISVAVADDWQRQGLGRRLLETLVTHARAHGVPRLYSIDAASNAHMRALARALGFRESPDPADIRQVVYSRDLST